MLTYAQHMIHAMKRTHNCTHTHTQTNAFTIYEHTHHSHATVPHTHTHIQAHTHNREDTRGLEALRTMWYVGFLFSYSYSIPSTLYLFVHICRLISVAVLQRALRNLF